jgi:hypothetical protein
MGFIISTVFFSIFSRATNNGPPASVTLIVLICNVLSQNVSACMRPGHVLEFILQWPWACRGASAVCSIEIIEVVFMDRSTQRMKRRGEPPACPFCAQPIPRPTAIASPLGVTGYQGGSCGCGAIFLLDATGREGGQMIVDGLLHLCQGDMDRAMALRSGVDYQLEGVGYNPRMHVLEPQLIKRTFGRPRLWFFKLLVLASA